jgi:hypothetical protein
VSAPDREPRVEIVPEPEPEEREAILLAAALVRQPPDGRGAWWREGLREALGEDGDR